MLKIHRQHNNKSDWEAAVTLYRFFLRRYDLANIHVSELFLCKNTFGIPLNRCLRQPIIYSFAARPPRPSYGQKRISKPCYNSISIPAPKPNSMTKEAFAKIMLPNVPCNLFAPPCRTLYQCKAYKIEYKLSDQFERPQKRKRKDAQKVISETPHLSRNPKVLPGRRIHQGGDPCCRSKKNSGQSLAKLRRLKKDLTDV